MNLTLVPLELARLDGLRHEAVLLPLCSDERPLRGAAGLCDWRAMGRLSRLLARGQVTGRAGEVALAPGLGRLPFDKVLFFGLGPSGGLSAERCALALESMVRALDGLRLRGCALALPGRPTGGLDAGTAARQLVHAFADAEVDEVAVLDEAAALALMTPVLAQERRRSRVARELSEG